MSDHLFRVAAVFGPHAGPRYARQGAHSGESLRKKLLEVLRKTDGTVLVVLDGMRGMGSSFLDEAFGGLVREEGIPKDEVRRRLRYQATIDPSYIETIRDSIERSQPSARVH